MSSSPFTTEQFAAYERDGYLLPRQFVASQRSEPLRARLVGNGVLLQLS